MSGGMRLLALLPSRNTASGRAWLVSFTDLVCLMLTFFVMLYAMSDPADPRYRALAGGLHGDRAVRADGQAAPQAAFNVDGLNREKAIDLGYLGRVFETQMADHPELAQVLITRRDGRLVLALPADLLFAPGDAALSPAGRKALFVLGGVAGNIGNALEVVGHTDPRPAGSRWPSNWELSLARAQAVADALHGAGYLRAITVRGQADAQFPETAPFLPVAERMRLARRVDVIVAEHGGAR